MKKFLYKLLIYTLLLSSITLGINLLYIHEVKDSSEKFAIVPDNIQICNFGSSHGYNSFNYEDAKEKYTCFNFALGAQSLLYDYRIFLNYRDKIQKDATVFLVVSYFSFFGEAEHKEDKTFASKNKIYYKFLPRELITEYDWVTDMHVNYLPTLSPESLSKLITNLLRFNGQTNTGIDIAKIDNIAMATYKNHFAGRFHAGKFDAKGKRLRRQESFDAIYKMINLCREIGARPVMVTTPYLHKYTDTVKANDPKFLGDFYAVIDEIKRNTGIEYYDYAFDSRFSKNYSLFIDSDHLNKEGARRFTDILFREVLGIDVGRAEEYGL